MTGSLPAAEEPIEPPKRALAWRTCPPGGRGRKRRCDCGRLAVAVATVPVGLDAVYAVEMPLCAECLELERELR
ncbi:MAG TPA: hypothetical protein PKM21_18740 [Anaerolineales bacterium]|nr:hypothetical protein [Anaerolineales bacterium]